MMEIFWKRRVLDYRHRLIVFGTYLYSKLVDCVSFLYVLMRFRFFRSLDFFGTIFKFYLKNRNFARNDFTIQTEYWFDSPFAISKRYLKLRLEPDVYQYGETPILTIEKIAKLAQITENDHVFELGCGTGRCAFWLAYFMRCRVTGIEQISDFVELSNKFAKKSSFLNERIHFIKGDFLSTDLSQATVIYLYGTKMNNAQIEFLILNLNKVRLDTKIITVSYNLNEIIAESKNYAILNEHFTIIAKFDAEFLWGKATVFIQKKSHS